MAEQSSPSDVQERARFAAELLPAGPRCQWLQAAVERILAQRLRSRAELVAYHEDRADICRRFAEQLPTMDRIRDRDAWLPQISEQEQHERQLAESYKRMPANYPKTRMRQVELLLAWETAGGDLKYERGRKKKADLHSPLPKGRVVSFLERTAGVKAGTTHNIITEYGKRRLKPVTLTQLAGAGSLHINEGEQHFYFIDKHGRKVYRDGRDEPDPDQGPAM